MQDTATFLDDDDDERAQGLRGQTAYQHIEVVDRA